MSLLSRILNSPDKRQPIVERLLANGNISAKEAVVLLKEQTIISVQKIEMSSGAKIVQGDDNECSYGQ